MDALFMKYARLLQHLEVPALILAPCVLLVCAFFQIEQAGILTLFVVVLTILIFFAGFELNKPALRQIMPTVVLASLAAAGRILFAPIPDFKPVSAICIMAGVVFGKRCGFMVGALAALCSNFFFGQGPWTPWQMYAWGMVGYFAGILSQMGVFGNESSSKHLSTLNNNTLIKNSDSDIKRSTPAQQWSNNTSRRENGSGVFYQSAQPKTKHLSLGTIVLICYGFLSGLGYGFILNSWYIVGFLIPVTWQGALAAYLAGLPFDLVHGIATAVFLLALYLPWKKKLTRIKTKYDL